MKDKLNAKWVLIRKGEVRQIFENRKEAVKYFKEALKQMLEDFDRQDKTNAYDYSIEIPETRIVPVDKREAHLGL